MTSDAAPTLLPQAPTIAQCDDLLADDAALSAGVAAIARRHGAGRGAPRRFDSGSLPVYALDDATVLKLYPPHERTHAEVEARALACVEGRLPIATPRVLAVGVQDGWPYLLMSHLAGRRLVEAWSDLTAADRDGVADALGDTVAALHALDVAALQDLPPDWNTFVAGQRRNAVEQQRERRLAAPWLVQIEPFLDAWMPPAPARRALLHTELMREHLMVDESAAGGATLCGLFDFEPAMIGDPAYDFASVGLFVTCGDRRLLQRTLRAYRERRGAAGPIDTHPCRLMAHALLHRYSNLRWYLERLPVPGATTLDQLAEAWWGTAP